MSSNEMEPKQWLRCNNCYTLMCKAKDPFSLTFCGHIFCRKCVRKASKQCPQCKSKDVPAMSLLEPLKPEVRHCFESSEELQEKIRQAHLFQTMQYSINCKRLNELDKKYTLVKMEYLRNSKEMKSLKEMITKCQIRESELEGKLKQAHQIRNCSGMMTPLSNVSSIAGSAQSISSLGCAKKQRPSFDTGHEFMKDQAEKRSQPFHPSMLTPMKLQDMDSNREFRIPTITKVPRSVGNSSRTSSSNSSRGTPFSNYTPLSYRR